MPEQIRQVHIVVWCVCGAFVKYCECPCWHFTRTVPVCGTCTQTNGEPVLVEEDALYGV